MNLVEQKEKYIKEREDLIKKREEIVSQLRELEISIERYNGAIVAVTDSIKAQESETSDTENKKEESNK